MHKKSRAQTLVRMLVAFVIGACGTAFAAHHEPEITGLMERLLENPAFVYPMKMARIATPGKIGYETPPHQDAHSHQGGPTMAGIWVALHDVAAGMGRLMLLPGWRGWRATLTWPSMASLK